MEALIQVTKDISCGSDRPHLSTVHSLDLADEQRIGDSRADCPA